MAITRVITADTTEEVALIAHVRSWCHNSQECRLCLAENRAYEAERSLGRVISG